MLGKKKYQGFIEGIIAKDFDIYMFDILVKKGVLDMINYKIADISDAELIYEMAKENIDEYEDTAKIDYEKVLDWMKRKIHDNIDSYKAIYYNDEKVGFFSLWEENNKLEIDDLYIFEAYRNKGIGTSIINECIKESIEKNIPIFLYVFIKNTKAVELYSRLGFEIVEKVRDTRYIMERSCK